MMLRNIFPPPYCTCKRKDRKVSMVRSSRGSSIATVHLSPIRPLIIASCDENPSKSTTEEITWGCGSIGAYCTVSNALGTNTEPVRGGAQNLLNRTVLESSWAPGALDSYFGLREGFGKSLLIGYGRNPKEERRLVESILSSSPACHRDSSTVVEHVGEVIPDMIGDLNQNVAILSARNMPE